MNGGQGKKKEIANRILKMSGKYSPYDIFSDWTHLTAVAIQNACHIFHNKLWNEREQEYMDIIKKYEPEEQSAFAEMSAYLVEALEDEPSDILGSVFMMLDIKNKAAGQFFTPFNVSRACARLTIQGLDLKEQIKLNEPSCGSGGMIIAAALELKERGVNYQRQLDVVAQDLDWKAVYMCYVQLSLLGIRAVCVQGDTLAKPYIPGNTDESHILRTPALMGMLI